MESQESQRQPYVRPFVLRLEYVTDVRVSQVCACKTDGSSSGAGDIGQCLDLLGGACSQCDS